MTKSQRHNPDNKQPLLNLVCLFDEDFSIDWLIGVSGAKPSEILLALEEMVKKGWAVQTGIGRFAFQDKVKKAQLLRIMDPVEKQALFQKMAAFFLKNSHDPDIGPAILARFLLNIENNVEGCGGLLHAGDAFVKSFQPEKALECYNKLREDLSRLQGEKADSLYMDMAIKTSKVSTARQSTTEVVRTLEEALKRAVKRKDRPSEALIRMHIAKNEWLLSHYDRAMKLFQEGWAIANRCRDDKLMRSAMALRMYFSFWQGRYAEVVRYYETVVSDVAKYPESGFPLLATITVGQCYAYTGQITQGLGMLDAILQSCRNDGDLHTAAFAVSTINSAIILIQSTEETLELALPAYDEIQQSENQYIHILTQGAMAYLYFLKGDTRRSTGYLKLFVENCRQVNIDTLHHRPYLLELCWAMEQGHYPRIMDLDLKTEVDKLLVGQNVFFKGLAYRYKAFLGIRQGQPSEVVIKSLMSSLKWLEASGHEFEILLTRLELLRQYVKANRKKQIDELMAACEEVVTKYHEDRIPPELKRLLSRQSSRRHQMKEMLRFGRDMMTITDTKDILQRIISMVNQLTGAERGAVFLLESKTGDLPLKLRASRNLTMEDVHDPEFDSSMALMKKVAAEPQNRAGYIATRQMDMDTPSPGGDRIRSRICVPIMFSNKVMGVLYHDNRLLNSVFKADDIELLSFYAGQAAVVLNNLALKDQLQALNEKLLEEQQMEDRRSFPMGEFDGIIGKSEAIRQTLFLVKQVAATDMNVLLLGETGVGKDLVASVIHYRSARNGRPFVKANCSALTETLINSELFGHERGAFTGAVSRRVGRFEMAHSGTLFMDEIGDLPLSSQANLLRTLQSGEFERVGGNDTVTSDFRLIAATNRNLKEMVREKTFRSDLYFRLNVFPIIVPPLRDRKEDIPLLVHHFISRFSRTMNKNIRKVPSEEMKKLMHHNWPGNIRELENMIQRGMVLSGNAVFKVPRGLGAPDQTPKSGHTLVDVERNHIIWALEQTNWKIRGPGGAAQLLDINPSTLAGRMKKLNITRPRK